MTRSSLKILLDIISKDMHLASGQAWIYDERFRLPKNLSLVVVAKWIHSSPRATYTKLDGSGSGLREVGSVLLGETYEIDLISASREALERKDEVAFALRSSEGKAVLRKHDMRLFQIFTEEAGYRDGERMLHRAIVHVEAERGYEKIRDIPYYDTFAAGKVVVK